MTARQRVNNNKHQKASIAVLFIGESVIDFFSSLKHLLLCSSYYFPSIRRLNLAPANIDYESIMATVTVLDMKTDESLP